MHYPIIVAWVTRPERPKGAKDLKGLQLEVGSRRAPRLLATNIITKGFLHHQYQYNKYMVSSLQAIHRRRCWEFYEGSLGWSPSTWVSKTSLPTWNALGWCRDWPPHEGLEWVSFSPNNFHLTLILAQLESIFKAKRSSNPPAKAWSKAKPWDEANKDLERSRSLFLHDLRPGGGANQASDGVEEEEEEEEEESRAAAEICG